MHRGSDSLHKIIKTCEIFVGNVSSFWDMRLNIACAATDAEFQNRIILHDITLNLPVVAQQPHPDPNYAPHAAARLLAVA